MANPIGNIGTIPTLTIANRVFTDTTSLIILGCTVSNASSGYRKFTASSGYQVTGGLSLSLYALQAFKLNATDLDSIVLGYSDNDNGLSGGTPTNPIYCGTGSSTSQTLFQYVVATDTTTKEVPLGPFIIPAAKYAFSSKGGGSQTQRLHVFGYEA